MDAAIPATDIGIVMALPREARTWAVRRRSVGDTAVVGHFRLRVAGIGAERARLAATHLTRAGAQALVSWGVAGALLPALCCGDLVLPDRLASIEGAGEVHSAWLGQVSQTLQTASLRVTHGTLWTDAGAVTRVGDKKRLAGSGCVATDMEAIAVAEVAAHAGVPFIAVKAICDRADSALPDGVTDLLDADGHARPAALLAAAAAGPRMWLALYRMQRDFALACRSLRQAAGVWIDGPGA